MSATIVRTPSRLVISDGKGRPGWADEATYDLYEATNEKAVRRGFSAMSCGWAMQPKPHGEYRVSDGTRAITVSEPTPAQAVETMTWLLDRMDPA